MFRPFRYFRRYSHRFINDFSIKSSILQSNSTKSSALRSNSIKSDAKSIKSDDQSVDSVNKSPPKVRRQKSSPDSPSTCRESFQKLIDRLLITSTFPDTLIKDLSPLASSSLRKVAYAGFDPTAASLHVGHLLVINSLLHLYRDDFDVIALIGGATAKLGDPSGRLAQRRSLDWTTIDANCRSIREQLTRIFGNFDEFVAPSQTASRRPIRFVDNSEWYEGVDVIRFVAEVGPRFRLSHMLGKDYVRLRSSENEGVHFAEFAYQLFQAYDWWRLYETTGCAIQIGGTDQIGNMHSGHDLIRSIRGDEADSYGLAVPLLLDAKGQKLGKSILDASGGGGSTATVWLDSARTSPFELYQYFLRSSDADVAKFLHLLTFLPLDEVDRICAKHDRSRESRLGQTAVADRVTLLVHGQRGLDSARRCTDVLYRGSIEKINALSPDEFATAFAGSSTIDLKYRPDMTLLEAVINLPFFVGTNESKAIEAIRTGGVSVNYQKIREPSCVLVRGVHTLANDATLALRQSISILISLALISAISNWFPRQSIWEPSVKLDLGWIERIRSAMISAGISIMTGSIDGVFRSDGKRYA